MHICGQFVAWNSPCIQNGAVPRHPVWCPPLYLARGCKISISFATCARRGRTDGGKGPPTFVERNKTPLPLSLLRVRLTPRLWVSLSVCLVLGCGRRHLSFLCRRCELPRAKSCATCFTALRKERGDILHLRSREGGTGLVKEQGEKVLISARHPRRRSVGRSVGPRCFVCGSRPIF